VIDGFTYWPRIDSFGRTWLAEIIKEETVQILHDLIGEATCGQMKRLAEDRQKRRRAITPAEKQNTLH